LLHHLAVTFHPGFQGYDGLKTFRGPARPVGGLATRLAVVSNGVSAVQQGARKGLISSWGATVTPPFSPPARH